MNVQAAARTVGSVASSSSDLSTSFVPLVRLPSVLVPISTDPSPHLLHDMPAVFSTASESPKSLSNRMHVSASSLSAPIPLDTMNIHSSPPSNLPPTSGLLSGFPPPCETFGMATCLDGQMAMEPSASIAPATDTHAAPPTMHRLPPTYNVGTSSLASALGTVPLPMARSRAGSTTSPGSRISSITYPSVRDGTSVMESTGVCFPPPDYHDANDRLQESPNLLGVPALATLLESIYQKAACARQDFSQGKLPETGIKIDELKRAVLFAEEAIAKISLVEASPPHTIISPSASQLPPTTPGLVGGNLVTMDPHAMHVNSEGLDLSRKRCASSLAEAGDRVIKAPKMEPPEEAPLTLSTSAPVMFPGLASSLSALTPAVMNHSLPPSAGAFVNRSLPASAAPSRPPSPSLLSLTMHHQQPHPAPNFPHMVSAPASIDFGTPSSPVHSAPPFPMGHRNRSSWSDSNIILGHRHHQHSPPAINANAPLHSMPVPLSAPPSFPFTAPGTFGSPTTPSPPKQRPVTTGAMISPIGRMVRSGSVTSAVDPLPYGFTETPSIDSFDFRASVHASSSTIQSSSTDSDDDDITEDDLTDPQLKNGSYGHSSPESTPSGVHGNEVPQEYRGEVDRIFFEFLTKICSNLDAADSKGEPIHQTLMAKKMQRLDESPDFRPFKFRIAAFTNAFLEELARQGYPEEKIPMKKIRNYLWKQTFIQRFNEDGKKAKSKGNHIWNIDAKKGSDGGWIFRPFHRKLAGSPPGIAYIGLRWSWTPRIWDPQAPSSHIPVEYSSPSLPCWLSWNEDVLSGIPPADAEGCDITAEATFVRDGREEMLSLTFHLNIAPISTLDTSFSPSRRPSVTGLPSSRRVQSDPVVPQVASRSALRAPNPPSQPASSQSAQVRQVLTTAAQRVAQSQVRVACSPTGESSGAELQALFKQQHVLDKTVEAFDKERGGQRSDGSSSSPSIALAQAAEEVVMQAARTVRADRSATVNGTAVAGGAPPSQVATTQQVTVNDVSVATQTAVAQAVQITGPLSSEVDVLMTATSLLQQHVRGPTEPLQPSPPVDGGVPGGFPTDRPNW